VLYIIKHRKVLTTAGCVGYRIRKKEFFELCVFKRPAFRCENNEWVDGKVAYAGRSGTYKTYMKFEDKDKLKVRAYFGVSLLGKTLYWTKEKQKREPK
jgi:hypothetical protein